MSDEREKLTKDILASTLPQLVDAINAVVDRRAGICAFPIAETLDLGDASTDYVYVLVMAEHVADRFKKFCEDEGRDIHTNEEFGSFGEIGK